VIRVARNRVPIPTVLDGPGSAGAEERRDNEARLQATPPDQPVFRVYKDPSVAEALNKLFAKKCAYCESKYVRHPTEVEHFRPKGEVRQTRDAVAERGYWWLAADWNNLFPSCIDCNRARYHDVRCGSTTQRAMRGKGDLFPLAAGVTTPKIPGCEGAEVPLLLDPCRDDPALVLAWADNGVVEARKDAAGTPNPVGVHSIECFGLDSNDLFLARRDHATRIKAVIRDLKGLEQDLRDAVQVDAICETAASQDKVAQLTERVRQKMIGLRRFEKPDQPFSAMAAALIKMHYRAPSIPREP
jgi:uncharacterized protein (TIGR02646 family)